jgi:hypothetical protein
MRRSSTLEMSAPWNTLPPFITPGWIPTTDRLRTEQSSRLDEAKPWYKCILEVDPHHKFATYVCGVINWQKGFELMRASGRYPRPLPDDEARRSLHAQIAPLLDESSRNLLPSLEIDPDNWYAMRYLS